MLKSDRPNMTLETLLDRASNTALRYPPMGLSENLLFSLWKLPVVASINTFFTLEAFK